jgi:hypothetical protein
MFEFVQEEIKRAQQASAKRRSKGVLQQRSEESRSNTPSGEMSSSGFINIFE